MILKPFFNFGDSPNLPATSKKGRSFLTRARAFWLRTYYVRSHFRSFLTPRFDCGRNTYGVTFALPSRARAFCQPARAGLALLQKSAIFGRGPNLQQSREYPEKAGFTGEGVTPAERRDDKNMRCPSVCPIKKRRRKTPKRANYIINKIYFILYIYNRTAGHCGQAFLVF